jgi:F-type H+-transporting ATPase subunit b
MLTVAFRFCLVGALVVGVAGPIRSLCAASAPAAAGAGGAGASKPDPLSFDPDLAIFTAVVFLLLLAILGKFAWKPIIEGLEKRERHIADNIAAAERAGEEARRTMAEYQAKLASAADEVRGMLEEARRDAEHTKQEIVAEAKAAASAEHDRQRREIRTATDAALKQLAEQSATLATELAGKIIRQKLNPQDHQKLIREAVEKFATGQPSRN